MSNTYILGWELGSIYECSARSTTGSSGTLEAIPAAARTGNYGMHIQLPAGKLGFTQHFLYDSSLTPRAFAQSFRFYFKLLHLPGTAVNLFIVGSPTVAALSMNPNGTLYVRAGSLNSANSTNAMTVDGGWHLMAVNAGYNAGNGAQVFVDGVLWASQTTGVIIPSNGTLFNVGSSSADTVGGFEAYYDDILVDNSSVTLGAGGSVLLPAAADSSTGSWLAGGGGATNLFNAVKNIPPAGKSDANATNTSQIHNFSASGNQDYKAVCNSYTSAKIDGSCTINAMQAVVNDGTPTLTARAGGVWVDSNPSQVAGGQSFEFGYNEGLAAINNFQVGWSHNLGPCFPSPTGVDFLGAPTVAVRKTDANSQMVDVDFMGMYVDYIPGSPGVSSISIVDRQRL
jgi:hypothetical protein